MLVRLLNKKHSNIQFQLQMVQYILEGKKIVFFFLKKLQLPMTADLCQSCLKSIYFMCTLHNYQPNLGASFQIQISNSIKLNLIIYIYIQVNTHVLSLSPFSFFIFSHSRHFKKNVIHIYSKQKKLYK